MSAMDKPINERILRWALFLSVLATLPHAWHLPISVTLYFGFLAGWRFISLSISKLRPGRFLLGLVTLAGALLVYTQHETLMGRDAGVSLLTIMLTLKLMELRKHRDIYVISFMGYFIVITQFLYNQSFLLTLYLLVMVLLITSLLVEINRINPSKNPIDPLRTGLSLAIQAVPIAAVLFILFPRISQPLWQLGLNHATAQTGLDDRVSPGSISHLIQSSSVAFRVRFNEQPPKPELRYWRGLVIWDTDGFEWFNSENQQKPTLSTSELQNPSGPFSYQIQLEPHNKKWLYSLDLPAHAPTGTQLTRDFQLVSKNNVNTPIQYQLTSYTHSQTDALSPIERQRALYLPSNVTQRELDLVKTWKQQTQNDQQLARLALAHFNTQPYVYTLMPPLYRKNPIDQFLFEGREGFCEHYATSFTQLMRIAGVPARLVLGYQGGEFNPMGGYFILRQSDAHAWSEIWLKGIGWKRVDPTAAVAPERVHHAFELTFSDIGSPALFQLGEGSLISGLYDNFRLVLDAANMGWRTWVIGYSQERQLNLFSKMGLHFNKNWKWAVLPVSIIGIILLLITLHLSRRGKIKLSPIVRSYDRLCRKLAHIGLVRDASEGPLDYFNRINRYRPDLVESTKKIFEGYIHLRYSEKASKQDEMDFHNLVRKFRPKKLP